MLVRGHKRSRVGSLPSNPGPGRRDGTHPERSSCLEWGTQTSGHGTPTLRQHGTVPEPQQHLGVGDVPTCRDSVPTPALRGWQGFPLEAGPR